MQIPVIYVASKQSVVNPGEPTRIHFDIHRNVNFFTNHKELREKIRLTFKKNRDKLLADRTAGSAVEAAG
jgi:hypothetical protein